MNYRLPNLVACIFTILVSVGSNMFSNVPLVILIVDQLDTLCGNDFENCHLLEGSILAWVSTIAANLTLFGSICNLIVAGKSMSCAKHKRVSNKNDYQLSFFSYLLFGVRVHCNCDACWIACSVLQC